MPPVEPARSSSSPVRAEQHAGRRPALDGLRAIAVLLVFGFHVKVPGMEGGFVGVDLFFVLSGYLITWLLIEEATRSGRIALGAFWARRVRRLLPAFLVVAVAVLGHGLARTPGFLREKLATDLVASLAYVANWRFIWSSTYFANDETVSPLQHVWSLAIEEQFYLLWPLAVALVLASLRGKAEALSRRLVFVAAAASVASAIAMVVVYAPVHPERAYMGTDARAFEPLIGALLACAFRSERVRGACARLRHALVAVGGLGVLAGAATLGAPADIRPAYFFGGAFAFGIACAVLIAGVESGPTLVQRVLSLRPVERLGAISYGVYLWHWPLAVWLLGATSRFEPARAGLVLVLTLVVSAASYVLVESPIRYGHAGRWLSHRRLAIVTPAVLVLLGAGSVRLLRPPPKSGFTVLLVGDSVPKRLTQYVSAEAEKRGWQAYHAAEGNCSTVPGTVTTREGEPFGQSELCLDIVPKLQHESIVKYQPDVVVWWSRYDSTHRKEPSGRLLDADGSEFRDAQVADVRAEIDRLTAGGARVLFVEQDRPGKGIYSRCSERDCHWFLAQLVKRHDLAERWNGLLREIARVDRRVRVTSLDDVFCHDSAVPCDDSLGAEGWARPDGTHFSPAAGPRVARALLDRIAGM